MPSEDGSVLVLQAHERDCLFLSERTNEEGVRLFRCVAPEPIEALDERLWTVNADGETGWTWLQDEWSLENASVMYHPDTGAMAWVRDLDAPDLAEVSQKWLADIEAWIAEADSLIERTGSLAEPLGASDLAE